ncbi:MAG TPA: FG-GAP-like repeat-containing protein [Gaiellaceae bacterium]|nr:FG-GAP-like repeat-containing protein [Gaiellaceae bacterium]
MSATAPSLVIRGTPYPVLLPKLRDPRLHLAATITSLQVIGQIGFHFEVSISQILLSLATCALLEVAIAFWSQRVILWPASAMLTGNGVAFVLRVPGTAHGDWWTPRGWWIFVGTAAVSLLSKHVIRWRGEHIFNPSNIGLVLCFLILGRGRAAPLDFWWGPMSGWLVAALVIIVTAGFAILYRLHLLRVALGFWVAFTAGIGILALAGHSMTARWHLGPISGVHFWWILITSPEVLVFLFFMITDPKTAPRSPTGRIAYAVALGLLASVLIAPTTTEFAAKVALLGSLAIVCAAMPVLRLVPIPVSRRRLLVAVPVVAAATAAAIVLSNASAGAAAYRPLPPGALPPITILPSQGVQTPLDRHTAELIAHDLIAVRPASTSDRLRIWLVQGYGQGPPTATAQLADVTYHLHQAGDGHWELPQATHATQNAAAPVSTVLKGVHLTNVASSVGLDFRQGAFRFGMSNETQAMMGGGVCWLDYNGDGWEDLYAVNSYASADTAQWATHGGLPRSELFENVHGRFRNVTAATHTGLQVQGNGCVAADLTGDGRPDIVVTTTRGVDVLWNDGNGRFTKSVIWPTGWYAGAAVADVNGDGRPDLFVAGYSDPGEPVPGSLAGFPTNVVGVRDLLFLNEGGRRFREVGAQAGIEAADFRHGLGAEFVDANHDGRPDLYVANDEDPNDLYVNVPWPGGAKADPEHLGFRFEERAAASGVNNAFAGMGIAGSTTSNGSVGLFVTNSRGEPSAAFDEDGARFTNARPQFDPALGSTFAGWGVSWVDLANSGTPDLVLAAGAIPVTKLRADAENMRVLAPTRNGYGVATGVLAPLRLNGRGLAAADAGNDGRMDVAVNTIGGKLVLLRPSGPSGHWIDVALSRFVPGAVVTALIPRGATLEQTVTSGSSYLSSADPRLHFGLGKATTLTLQVQYPWGAVTTLQGVRADRVVHVAVPALRRPLAQAPLPSACTPASHSGSIATTWEETAIAVLGAGGMSEPVQARDLLDLSEAMTSAAPSPVAISYAAYRLLLWQASYGANLDTTFALLTNEMRSLCNSIDLTTTRGASAAAVGNRIAAASIAAGRNDGSHESLHFADPGYVPENAPLAVSQTGTTVHDATFWQPLSYSRTNVQTFVDAQWGGVRTYAGRAKVGKPPFGLPTSKGYEDSVIAVLRATSHTGSPTADTSPLYWNRVATTVATGDLASDLRLYRTLNGALNDAAVSAWSAKRTYQAPRPISMVRYLAFNGELPVVAGVTKREGRNTLVLRAGRWVNGASWTPLAPTPASPGWVSESGAFAYAANEVLSSLAGRSFGEQARRAATAGLAEGIETPADEAAGRAVGTKVGKLALEKR